MGRGVPRSPCVPYCLRPRGMGIRPCFLASSFSNLSRFLLCLSLLSPGFCHSCLVFLAKFLLLEQTTLRNCTTSIDCSRIRLKKSHGREDEEEVEMANILSHIYLRSAHNGADRTMVALKASQVTLVLFCCYTLPDFRWAPTCTCFLFVIGNHMERAR